MDGVLCKWTNYLNGWQQRYFTLRDGVLSYYNSESDIDTGCKGAFKISMCDVVVHATDPCRFEILIPGEQRFFLKAINSTERQRWIIALGSCKAGITNVEDIEKMQRTERSIEEKRSELRINRDLLVQQVCGVCSALKSRAGENEEMLSAMNSLKATCDTLLANADELISLLSGPNSFSSSAGGSSGGSGRYRLSSRSVNATEASPGISEARRKPGALPQSLNNSDATPTTNTHTNIGDEISPRSTRLIEQIATTAASTSSRPTGSNSNGSLLNNHLRALRLSRLYPTFFSKMEFSFEDLALSHSSASSASTSTHTTSISAVEFLACCRSLLTFFPALASANDNSGGDGGGGGVDLTKLGSLQTVYAQVLADVVRLEQAVKALASGEASAVNGGDGGDAETARQRSLALSLADIVDVEVRANQCRKHGSAYLALLWLARSLNFTAEFLDLLFKDTTTAFRQNPTSNAVIEEIATKAYSKTLSGFHDWSMRGTATVILKAVPSAERLQMVLLDSDLTPPMEAMAQLELDVERFVEALRRCLACVQALLVLRQLDPVFPPPPV